jgi:hypothetical protein
MTYVHPKFSLVFLRNDRFYVTALVYHLKDSLLKFWDTWIILDVSDSLRCFQKYQHVSDC